MNSKDNSDNVPFSENWVYDLMPDYRFPDLPEVVQHKLTDIKDSRFTDDIKREWIKSVADLFKDENIYLLNTEFTIESK
jgi:hypothetical protein